MLWPRIVKWAQVKRQIDALDVNDCGKFPTSLASFLRFPCLFMNFHIILYLLRINFHNRLLLTLQTTQVHGQAEKLIQIHRNY